MSDDGILVNVDDEIEIQRTVDGIDGIRVGEVDDDCCGVFWIEARLCSDGSRPPDPGIWFQLNSDGTIATSIGDKPLPFYFVIVDGDGTKYYVNEHCPLSCIPQDTSTDVEETDPCIICDLCADPTPPSFNVVFDSQDLNVTGAEFPTNWYVPIINGGESLGATRLGKYGALNFTPTFTLSGELGTDPFCVCFIGLCKWRGSLNAQFTIDEITIPSFAHVPPQVGDHYDATQVGDSVTHILVTKYLIARDRFAFRVTATVDFNITWNDGVADLTGTISVLLFSGTIEENDCSGATYIINNGLVNPPAGVSYDDPRYSYFGHGKAPVIGGLNGTASVSSNGSYCAFLPKYRLTIAGTAGTCEAAGHTKGDGNVDDVMDDGGPGLDISTDYTMDSPPNPVVVKSYSDAGCTMGALTIFSGDVVVTIGMSAQGGGVAEVTVQDSGHTRVLWYARADYFEESPGNPELTCGYPADITLSYHTFAGFDTPFQFGSAHLEMLNAAEF